jgi:transcriptional regulator with XRE-family HTH domain
MFIGLRIRQLRQQKGLSQGDIERKTDMVRCYVSRIENGHSVPRLDTLQKLAAAMDVPLYQFFYEEQKPTRRRIAPVLTAAVDGPFARKLHSQWMRMGQRQRNTLFRITQVLASEAVDSGAR